MSEPHDGQIPESEGISMFRKLLNMYGLWRLKVALRNPYYNIYWLRWDENEPALKFRMRDYGENISHYEMWQFFKQFCLPGSYDNTFMAPNYIHEAIRMVKK